MKAHLIPFIACILLCFSSCGAAEAAKPDTGSKDSIPLTAIGSEPIEPEVETPAPVPADGSSAADDSSDTEQPSPEKGEVVSEYGEVWDFLNDPAADPEEMTKILWYRANSLYDVENLLTTVEGIKHPDSGIRYEAFYNYSGAVENTFTEKCIMEYESCRQGQPGVAPQIYISPDGRYYRMGPWATHYNYRNALQNLSLKSDADGRYTYKVGFPDFYANESDIWDKEFSELEQTSIDMTIVFENGKWLVDSFTDPRLA